MRLKIKLYRKKRAIKLNLAMLFLLELGLIACNDNPAPTGAASPGPNTVSITITSHPENSLVPASNQPAFTATTLPALTVANTPTFTVPSVATSAAPTASLTALPNSPTSASFKPEEKQIGPPTCCQNFNFAGNGLLYFYDKPAGANQPATYTLDPATGQRQLFYKSWGDFTPDLGLVATSDKASGTTVIEQVGSGIKRATLQNRAAPTLISPDQKHLAYLLRSTKQAGPEEPQLFELWTGNLDGSNLKVSWTLREGDNLSWFPDSRHLLLTARDAANQRFGLWVVDLQTQNATLIIESKGLTAANSAVDGLKIVYAVTLQNESGIWLANGDGSNRHKFDWVGGWRWSVTEPDELFYIPIRTPGETSSSLWVYKVSTGQNFPLTDPAQTRLQILGDQWQISPDNKTMAYHGPDNSLRLLRFRP